MSQEMSWKSSRLLLFAYQVRDVVTEEVYGTRCIIRSSFLALLVDYYNSGQTLPLVD